MSNRIDTTEKNDRTEVAAKMSGVRRKEPHKGAARNRRTERVGKHRDGGDRRAQRQDDGAGRAGEDAKNRQGRHKDPNDPRNRRYLLPVDVVDEVIDLVLDLPGQADERLLYDAFERLYEPVFLTGEHKGAIERGELVGLVLDADERFHLRTLIEEFDHRVPVEVKARTLDKLRAARHRARS